MITLVRGTGFPPPDRTAGSKKMYEGLYYYDAYFMQWDKIEKVDQGEWTVHQVDEDGKRIAETRVHVSPMWTSHFANKPFRVN